ncbi:MAG: hypothetical protein KDB92_03375 [Chitinophagaceae bacterium]|nr:hypothetical protein [Chitinophagaceae bacterium]
MTFDSIFYKQTPIGYISQSNYNDSISIFKIYTEKRIPIASKIEFKEVSLIHQAKIYINYSRSKDYYKFGDTVLGAVKLLELK